MLSWKASFVLMGLGLATVAMASVDTSPKPGGVFQLKPGIYVPKDLACGSAATATVLRYDGLGLSA